MRISTLIFTSTIACTMVPVRPEAATSNVAVAITRDQASAQPAIILIIVNTLRFPICIRVDALRNPYSYEMNLKMRNVNGRNVQYNDPGYIADPLEGIERLEPGESVQGRTYLYPRFKLKDKGRSFPAGMFVQASFYYNHCDVPLRLQARSSWQSI